MTIIQLKYILAVAEHNSFTKAAQACFVTQPTLSAQIQKLEEELNVLLFDRESKPVSPTSIGYKIIDQAKITLKESNRIQDIISLEKKEFSGVITLATIPTLSSTLLPIFLKQFCRFYEDIHLEIEVLKTEEIIHGLQIGSIDVALVSTPLNMDSILEKPFFYEPFYMYLPQVNNETVFNLDSLEMENILTLEEDHCLYNQLKFLCHFKDTNFTNNFSFKSGNIETLIEMVDNELGYTLLPYLHTLKLNTEQRTRLYPIEGTKPAREVGLVYHKSFLKFHIVEALLKQMKIALTHVQKFSDIKILNPLDSSNYN